LLMTEKHCSYFFVNLLKVLYSLVDTLHSGLKVQWWFESWLETIPYFKGGFMGASMWSSIVCKFDNGEKCGPVVLLEISTYA